MNTCDMNQWIELSREAYVHNLAFFRRLLGPDRELCVVVKANAYGHGMVEIAGMARGGLVDSFAVHSLEEAAVLRRMGVKEEILVMGYTPRSRLAEILELDLRTVVYDAATLEELDRLAVASGRKAKVHVKVEAGTYRQGVEGPELERVLAGLKRATACEAEGVYTHFANIEDTTRHDFARAQMEAFDSALKLAESMGVRFGKIHSACSAAALLFPETYGSMVRLGISQYGLWPSRQTYLSYRLLHPEEKGNGLQPVLTWKCRISQIKEVPAGRYVGYGCTYLTTRPSRLAVLPVGYSDGYDRALSNVGYVLVKGRRAQIRGRVCMNLIMVDVTDIPGVAPQDEVVLLGGQDGACVSVDDVAELVGTINYEVVSRILPTIPRLVV